MRWFPITGVALVSLFCGALLAKGEDITETHCEGTFSEDIWHFETWLCGSGYASVTRDLDYGHPAASVRIQSREITLPVDCAFGVLRWDDYVFDPANHDLLTVSLKIDTDDRDHYMKLLVYQDGHCFGAPGSWVWTGTTEGWHSVNLGPYLPDAFALHLEGDSWDSSQWPKFGGDGSPLRFGFAAGGFGPPLVTVTQNYDNFCLTVKYELPVQPVLTTIADGNWNAPTTWDHGTLIPTADIQTVVEKYTATVAADGAALSLLIRDSGALVVNDNRGLEIGTDVEVGDGTLHIAPAGVLNVGSDATMGVDSQYACQLDSSANGLIAAAGDVLLTDQSTLSLQVTENLRDTGEKQRTIITADGAGGIDGVFGHQPAPGDYLAHGVFFAGSENEDGAYKVTLFQALAGDTDGNGDVGPTDLSTLVQNWAPAGTDKLWREGNFNDWEDRDVDPSDLSTLVLYWAPAGYLPAEGAARTAGSAAVPEPGTLLLLAVGVFGLLACRRRRR